MLALSVLALGQFQAPLAGELVRVAGAMGCPASSITSWTAPPIGNGGVNAPQPAGQSPEPRVHLITNSTEGTFGAVVKVDRENAARPIVLVSFRATMVPANCANNDDEFLVPYPPNPSARVHQGFYRAYTSVRTQTLAAIASIGAEPGVTGFQMLVLTGWSMGGAMGSYLAMELRQLYPTTTITYYGFGMPRVGDAAFASAFAALPQVNAVNVWHRGDPIPECGLFDPDHTGCTQYARGFRHAAGTTVWYSGGLAPGPPYTTFPSDTVGSGPTAAQLDGDDHLYYMGEGMWCCNPGGPNNPVSSPAEGGLPVGSYIGAQCSGPSAPGCNPGRLVEPANAATARVLSNAAKAAVNSMQAGSNSLLPELQPELPA